jgi:F0F1-type ATP synthase assembly protein I
MPDETRSSEGPKGGREARGAEPDHLAKLNERRGASSLGGAGKYAGLGLQFALSILIFLYAGQWLDRRLGTGSVFLVVGVFVGASAAFYSMYRTLVKEQRRMDEEMRDRKRGTGREGRRDEGGRGSGRGTG